MNRWMLVGCVTTAICYSLLCGIASAQTASDEIPLSVLTEPLPALLDPQEPRSEMDQDHIDATALYATARTLEQQGDLGNALRHYQRAYRYDTRATSILRDVIPLAFRLGRQEEAIRYAVISVEREPSDTTLMRRIAMHLTEQGDWERALKIYEDALKQLPKQPKRFEHLMQRMEAGRLFFLAERYDEASQSFALVESVLPENKEIKISESQRRSLLGDEALTYQLFAECYFHAGKFSAAERAWRVAEKKNPQPGFLQYNLARIAAKQNKPEQALQHLQVFFDAKQTREAAAACKLLEQLLQQNNQTNMLLDKLETLHTQDPTNQALTLFLARRTTEKGNLTRAKSLYQEMLSGATNDFSSRAAYQGLLSLDYKNKSVAAFAENLAKAVALSGTLELYMEELQPVIQDKPFLDKLFQSAKQNQNKPDYKPSPGEHLALAQLAMMSGRFDTAKNYYQRALQSQADRSAELLLTWGLELYMKQQYDRASEVFQTGIQEKHLPADNPAFHFYLAGSLAMAGKNVAALAAARTAATARPEVAQYASRPAWVQYHAKQYDAAIKDYEALLKKFDDDFDSTENREVMREVRLILSNLYVLKKDHAQAEQWLEEILDEFPEDIGALNDLGYLWADQNKHLQRSLQMIRRAVAEEPENRAYLDSLGWVLYRLGRYQEALAALGKATQEKDSDGVILEHLGDVHFAAKQRAEAKAAWTRARDAFRESGEKEKQQRVEAKLKRARLPQ